MVCDEDTTANGPTMGGLSRCVLKGTCTVLRGERGSDAPNLPDLTRDITYRKRITITKKRSFFKKRTLHKKTPIN